MLLRLKSGRERVGFSNASKEGAELPRIKPTFTGIAKATDEKGTVSLSVTLAISFLVFFFSLFFFLLMFLINQSYFNVYYAEIKRLEYVFRLI